MHALQRLTYSRGARSSCLHDMHALELIRQVLTEVRCVQHDSWSIRFLPQVATAVYPHKEASTPGLSPSSPGVLVLHHFSGTWKASGGYASFNIVKRTRKWLRPPPPAHVQLTPVIPFSSTPEVDLYPVSINQAGAVCSMLVHLVGHGDVQSREDVSAALTRFGNWQAGMDNALEPRAPVALIGALGKAAAEGDLAAKPALLDIGAGYGVYTLTAAARGHRVIATELATRSAAALRAAVELNDFGDLVHVVNVTVGASEGIVCTEAGSAALAAGWRREDVQRGYAAPQLHETVTAPACAAISHRVTMDEVVPLGVQIGAVRVSAGGWAGDVLRGGLPLIERQRPAALLVEVDMAEMARVGRRKFAGRGRGASDTRVWQHGACGGCVRAALRCDDGGAHAGARAARAADGH